MEFTLNHSPASALPQGFVYLKDVDHTIIENLRYYLNENLVGKRIEGYKANKAILTFEAAKALSKVQQQLLKDGYSLVVYDAYRPTRAVSFFKQWSLDIDNRSSKDKYYPTINKADAFKLGFIAEKSSHSRGSTVDVTIIKLGNFIKNISISNRQLKDGSKILFLDDGTVDMGSSFDLFSKGSYHDSNLVDNKFLRLRNYLREIMKENGFNDYKQEWWHYTLSSEPFPNSYFNFEIQ